MGIGDPVMWTGKPDGKVDQQVRFDVLEIFFLGVTNTTSGREAVPLGAAISQGWVVV